MHTQFLLHRFFGITLIWAGSLKRKCLMIIEADIRQLDIFCHPTDTAIVLKETESSYTS